MPAVVPQATGAIFMRAPAQSQGLPRRMSGQRVLMQTYVGLTTLPSDYGRHFATMLIAFLQRSLSRHNAQVHASQLTLDLGLRLMRDR
jgi:hypothetical protein